jgi:hypothetical protein
VSRYSRHTAVRTSLISAITLLCVACGGGPAGPSEIADGTWGGDNVLLTVSDTGSHVEFGCAHGDMPGRLIANDGSFAASGTFVREHGGPIRVDEPQDVHPALYSGTIAGATLKLSVRLTDSGEAIGSFSLLHGAPGRVAKCL